MLHQNKFVESVAKLVELTQKRTLKWEKVIFPPSNSYDEAYEVNYEGHKLRLSENKRNDDLSLCLVDPEGNVKWEFPDVIGLWDLWQSVQFVEADVDEFLDSLLGKDFVDEDDVPF